MVIVKGRGGGSFGLVMVGQMDDADLRVDMRAINLPPKVTCSQTCAVALDGAEFILRLMFQLTG